jgi:HAD superfamily hydrolase (TIGR01459 family)
MTRLIPHLRELAPRYDVIFSDIWGVVHNGVAAYAEACAALAAFRAGGGKVVLISNAPRPYWSVMEQLDRLGAPRSTYDAVVASGDVTHELALSQPVPRCYHIGAPHDDPLFRDLAVERTGMDSAAFIICSGLRNDESETAEDYRAELTQLAARQLPMVCANTDLVVERGTKLIACAGALAAIYQELGGAVIQAGKPFPRIYEKTLAKAESLLGRPADRGRILAIGDAIRTDVIGARNFGIDCLFLTSGIHAHQTHDGAGHIEPAKLAAFLATSEAQPSAIMRHLVW